MSEDVVKLDDIKEESKDLKIVAKTCSVMLERMAGIAVEVKVKIELENHDENLEDNADGLVKDLIEKDAADQVKVAESNESTEVTLECPDKSVDVSSNMKCLDMEASTSLECMDGNLPADNLNEEKDLNNTEVVQETQGEVISHACVKKEDVKIVEEVGTRDGDDKDDNVIQDYGNRVDGDTDVNMVEESVKGDCEDKFVNTVQEVVKGDGDDKFVNTVEEVAKGDVCDKDLNNVVQPCNSMEADEGTSGNNKDTVNIDKTPEGAIEKGDTVENVKHKVKVVEFKDLMAVQVKIEKDSDIEDGIIEIKEEVESVADEEDVPADFFDDFLNQDFMAGLDVVDAWEEADECNVFRDKVDKATTSSASKSKRASKKNTDESKKHSAGSKHAIERAKLRGKQQTSKELHPNAKDRSSKHDEILPRRDLVKTRRDIQKDKDKCAKDKEVRMISERLKVVETGLVPPGMEMEVDLSEIRKRTGTLIRKEDKRKMKVEPKSPNNKEHDRIAGKRKYVSPLRYKRSFEKGTNEKRVRNISPALEALRKRSRERKSQQSDVSEREVWLRNRKHQKFGRDVSGSKDSFRRRRSHSVEFSNRKRPASSGDSSPVKKKGKSFLEELDAKLSQSTNSKIYKDIQNKLNPVYVAPNMNMHQPMMHPHAMMQPNNENFIMMAQPVPAPMGQSQFQHQMMPQYDERYFVGQMEAGHFQQEMQPPVCYTPAANPFYQQNDVNPYNVTLQNTAPVETVAPSETPEADREAFDKLFADKKITLTDYLRLTAKLSDPSKTISIQKKIKVIRCCQDAIKELSGESKKGFEFFYKRSEPVKEKPTEVKYQSPLKKIPLVRFQFTTPHKKRDQSQIARSTYKLLDVLGMGSGGAASATGHQDSSASQPAAVSSSTEKVQKNVFFSLAAAQKVSVSTQTEPTRCEKCDIRSARIFTDKDIQTLPAMTLNIATQVQPSDLHKKSAPNFKNKSLAYLTPAQLLGQSRQKGGKNRNYANDFDLSSEREEYTEFDPRQENEDRPPYVNDRNAFNRGNRNKKPFGRSVPYGNDFESGPPIPSSSRFNPKQRPFEDNPHFHGYNPPMPDEFERRPFFGSSSNTQNFEYDDDSAYQ